MEIEVSEYVRDCDGFIVKVNEIQDYKEEDDIWYEEKTLRGTWKSMIIKHSKNIIDLIEVGDIVEICDVLYNDIIYILSEEMLKALKEDIENGIQIKSIVTKEMFENVEYRVGE